jgi:hypothetical protein
LGQRLGLDDVGPAELRVRGRSEVRYG